MAQTPEARSRIMRAIKSRDTKPELLVRSLAHRLGFRFRVCRKDLPGNPDIVFARLRKVIFVHGCFWHGHDCGKGVRIPAQNRSYWNEKIVRNARRDEAAQAALAALGWKVAVFWECGLKDEKMVVARLREFLGEQSGQRPLKHPPQTGKPKLARQPPIRSGTISTKATSTG